MIATFKFPKMCYTLLLSTGELIRIDYGERQYQMYRHTVTGQKIIGLEAYEKVKVLNAELGVPWNVVQAMECGSMFGWDSGGAHPDRYKNEDHLLEIAKRFEPQIIGRREGFLTCQSTTAATANIGSQRG